MAKIQFDDRKQVQRAGKRPSQGADFGMAPLRAATEFGGMVSQVSKQVGSMAQEYALKNKRTDMKADELKYEAEKRRIFDEAEAQAAEMTDKKDIDKVYDRAQNEIDAYAGSVDPDTGIPRIRFEDQKVGIKGDAQNMRVIMEAAKAGRKLEVSRANTVAIYKGNMTSAIKGLDYAAMRENTNMMVGSHFTQDEADLAYSEAVHESESMRVDQAAKMIDTMIPADAVKAAAEFNDTVDGMQELTDEEKSEAKADITYKAERRAATQGYNDMNARISKITAMAQMGDITSTQEINSLTEVMEEIPDTDPQYKSILEGRAYSALGRAYKQERTELNSGFKRLASGMDSGKYKLPDLDYFMQGRVEDFNDLQRVAASARATLETHKNASSARSSVGVLNAIDYAFAGEKDGEPYSISDAFADMKKSNSKLAPLGAIILGAGMMAPDSAVDASGMHANWVVPKDEKWPRKNTSVPVAGDSYLAEGVRMMGAYIADGDEDADWVEQTFTDMVKIQNDENITPEDKRTARNALFKDRSRVFAAATPAPQAKKPAQRVTPTITTADEYDALPSGTRYVHPDGTTRTKS